MKLPMTAQPVPFCTSTLSATLEYTVRGTSDGPPDGNPTLHVTTSWTSPPMSGQVVCNAPGGRVVRPMHTNGSTSQSFPSSTDHFDMAGIVGWPKDISDPPPVKRTSAYTLVQLD